MRPDTLRQALLVTALASGLLAPALADEAPFTQEFPAYAGEPEGKTAQVRVGVQELGAQRRYLLSSDAPQRDAAPGTRTVLEAAAAPQLRSANLLFDALFAQAIDDARQDSVGAIHDGAYAQGRPLPCDCFETGEKWTYVWTRDLAYSADLALALLDPQRTQHSLRFKISPFRPGVAVPATLPTDSLQIVQDTGSGGSWPVSSDRVAWALGARAALAQLQGAAHDDFARTAYRALRGSLEADREAIFDAEDGLYRGEESFLDWREQSYAPYVVRDLTQLAQSKALSTNVLHYSALQLAAELAPRWGTPAQARRYAQWAQALKAAINERFWLPGQGLYASLTTPDAPAAPVARFDLLGEALAITSGVADAERAREVLAHYPQAPFGAPVIYPQQPDTPVYHNRAIWPFASAYALAAAARAGNVAVADQAVDTLLRAAALHLTNTENLEWLTGRSRYDDGPVINSPRQLWSVAAYIGMVTRTIFGYQADNDGLRVQPFLSAHLRRLLGGSSATLASVPYQGRRLSIVLHLPPAADEGYYPVGAVRLNGVVQQGPIRRAQLHAGAGNVVEVEFLAPRNADMRLTRVPTVSPLSHDDAAVFAPPVPVLQLTRAGAQLRLQVAPDPRPTAPALQYDYWRDGTLALADSADAAWTDPLTFDGQVQHCYRVVARYRSSGNASHPSAPACTEAGVVTIDWEAAQARGGTASGGYDYQLDDVRIARAGTYALALRYDNHRYALNTGITNAVKRLEVLDAEQRVVASAIVQMPHIQPEGAVHPQRLSTPLRAVLPAGNYRIVLRDYFNMSYLASNETYVHAGGVGGPHCEADISALQITRVR